MKPLPPFKIRDLNREIQERLQALRPMQELAVVKSFKKGKCYGIGLNDPGKDLILQNFVTLMGGLLRPYPAAEVVTNVTLYDNTGTSRTVSAYQSSLTAFFNYYNGGVLLGFGNPASPPTPARTDYELAALVTRITPSSTTVDTTNWRVIVTGSYVWTAGGTVRETGLYGKWNDTGSTVRIFLLFHDAISPGVDVPAGATVSVTYAIQF